MPAAAGGVRDDEGTLHFGQGSAAATADARNKGSLLTERGAQQAGGSGEKAKPHMPNPSASDPASLPDGISSSTNDGHGLGMCGFAFSPLPPACCAPRSVSKEPLLRASAVAAA